LTIRFALITRKVWGQILSLDIRRAAPLPGAMGAMQSVDPRLRACNPALDPSDSRQLLKVDPSARSRRPNRDQNARTPQQVRVLETHSSVPIKASKPQCPSSELGVLGAKYGAPSPISDGDHSTQ
jgi:hypothetical protein